MAISRNILNTLIVVAVVTAVAVVLGVKHGGERTTGFSETADVARAGSAESPSSSGRRENLPALVDLGAGKCIPCKMMAPILEEIGKEYADRFSTTFYDVWKDPEPGKRFGVRVIPTQVFLDPEGKELFRHEGFFSKEDILGKWKELGYDMQAGDE